jgi:hypothetical protein
MENVKFIRRSLGEDGWKKGNVKWKMVEAYGKSETLGLENLRL